MTLTKYIDFFFDIRWDGGHTKQTGIRRETDNTIRINVPYEMQKVIDDRYNSSLNVVYGKDVSGVINSYVWTEGDRIRMMYLLKNNDSSLYVPVLLDYEIIGQNIYNTGTVAQSELVLRNFDYESTILGNKTPYNKYYFCVCEIYSPAKKFVSTQKYYEIGEKFEIGNDANGNLVHKGQNGQNQSFSTMGVLETPATGTFLSGDTYIFIRYVGGTTNMTFPVESMHFSDFYKSDVYDNGRVNNIVKDIKKKRLQICRHSQKYLQNTQTNGLSTFFPLDYTTLDDINGIITGIVQVTDMLKIKQQRQFTSIYINKKLLSNADGSREIVATDTVFGTKIPSPMIWGCSQPESILRHNRHVYSYDIRTGDFIRDAANGMVSISHLPSNKMSKYFNDIKSILSNASNIKVQTEYFEKFDLLFVTFTYTLTPVINREAQIPVTYSETIVFKENAYSEEKARWIVFISHYKQDGNEIVPIDMYASVDNYMMSFMGGNVYLSLIHI